MPQAPVVLMGSFPLWNPPLVCIVHLSPPLEINLERPLPGRIRRSYMEASRFFDYPIVPEPLGLFLFRGLSRQKPRWLISALL
jgi:hypothetical protein